MVDQPGAGFQAVMAAQIIGDDEDLPRRIVHFDLFEEFRSLWNCAQPRNA